MIVKIFGRKSFTQTKKASSSVRKVTSDLLRYIENEEKIYGINGNNIDEEIDFISNEECFHTVLDYISNENKTKKTYVSGYLCDPEFAVEQFIDTKMQNLRRVGKSLEDDTGNQLFHIVQSFPDDLDISDDEVHQCGIELCKKIGVHQAVIASHLHPVFDENGEPHGKQKHNHIMINSHIYQDFIDPEHPDKMKYNDCKETYRQLQIWNDEISVEHGFPIIESDKSNTMYSWTASSIDNENRSWLARMQNDIKETMFSSYDWNDFLEKMKAAGYVISEGKYVTYTAPDRIHKARDKRLGSSYTKAYLNDYFALKSNLSAEVQSEIHKNNDTLSSEQLSDLIKKSPELLYVSIPRRHKKTGKPYKFNLKLNEQLEKSTIETYVNDAAIYPLYNSKKEKLGDVQGSTLKTAIYKTYEEQKRFEEEETRRNTASDITAILKKCQNEFEFSNRNYKNSKTNTPYRISIYNENGTKRTLLEQLLILSMVVVNNEVPEFALTEKQRRTIEKQNATLAIIIAKPDWKTQRIIEAINAAKGGKHKRSGRIDSKTE